jgi:tRNA dimethylallyltransferase
MMERGFLREVEALLERGYEPSLKPMQGLGYKRLCAHLAGELSLEEAVHKTVTDTRRFAKRQLTWFRSERQLEWIEPRADRLLERAADLFAASGGIE